MAMGDFDAVGKIEVLDLGDEERKLILGANALRALNGSA
jgi:hypothetical protein